MAESGSAVYNNVALPIPGVYGFVNPQGLSFQNANTPVVFLVGNSVGGKPQTPLKFNSYGSAQQALQGGDLLDSVRYAMIGGAGTVVVYRPYTATQSGLTLKDGSANPSILLSSSDWGQWTNAILTSISGSVGALIAKLVDNYHNTTLTSLPLGPAIAVSYIGNGTTASLTVSDTLAAPTLSAPTTNTTGGSIPASTAVFVTVVPRNSSGGGLPASSQTITTGSTTATNTVSTSFTANPAATSFDVYAGETSATMLYYGNILGEASGTIDVVVTSIPTGTSPVPATETAGPDLVTWLSGQSDGSVNLDINLAGNTVLNCQALTAYINGQPGYTAVLQAGAGNILSTQIDPTTQSIKTSYTLTSALGSVIAWYNSTGLVAAQAASSSALAPATVGLTPFQGGSNGTASSSTWQDAANFLGTYSPLLRYVVPLTTQITIMDLFNQAIAANSAIPSQYLQEGFYGGAIGDSSAAAIANASVLNSQRAVYAWPDFWDNNTLGVVTNFNGYTLAAYYAGLRAGLPPEMPLTGKQLNILSLGQSVSVGTISTLNQSGVAAAMQTPNGRFIVSLGTTTDNVASQNNNLYYTEESVSNSVDSLILWMVQQLDAEFRGQTNFGAMTTQLILSFVGSLLNTAQNQYHWIAGFVAPTAVVPLLGNPTFLQVPITVYVVSPLNGIVLSINLQLPVNSTAVA